MSMILQVTFNRPDDIFDSYLCWCMYFIYYNCEGFPHSSVGGESTCNAGDPSLISGSGRSPGKEISYALQYSWASLVAQMVENPPGSGRFPGGGHGNLL